MTWSAPRVLGGCHATLEPLSTAHADGLRAALADGALSALWYTAVPSVDAVDAYVADAIAQRDAGRAWPFAVRDAAGDVVGCTRFYDLDPSVPRATIGYTWVAPRAQRTGVNTECKRMLLADAFERLGCEAVAFETSWFNHTSRAAIARLGAKQDGVLRSHRRHPDGTLRDTVMFSIVAAEWPTVRAHLDARLARGGAA